jgi:hypothetical protein
MKRFGTIFVLLLVIVSCTLALAGQKSSVTRTRDSRAGKITGIVVDENDARIPGARIKIEGGRLSLILASDVEGMFEAELPPGTYRVSIWMDGFKRFDLRPFRLKANAREQLSVRMQVQPPQSTLKIE